MEGLPVPVHRAGSPLLNWQTVPVPSRSSSAAATRESKATWGLSLGCVHQRVKYSVIPTEEGGDVSGTYRV